MTECERLDEVVKALNKAIEVIEQWVPMFEQYNAPAAIKEAKTAQIAMDALELLRTRVPRVMTLEEIEEVEVVWLEDKNEPLILPALCIGRNDYDDERRVGFNITYKNGLYDCKSIYPLKSEYLVRWRAWSERPTDEQRNGEKWI